jgi:hypothetical protein
VAEATDTAKAAAKDAALAVTSLTLAGEAA